MSRYADKRRHHPLCAERQCSIPATKLMLIQSKPAWLCDFHYGQHAEEARA